MDGGLQVRKLMLATQNPLRFLPGRIGTALAKRMKSKDGNTKQRHCLMRAHAGRTFLQRPSTITSDRREAQRSASHLIFPTRRGGGGGGGGDERRSSPSISERTRQSITLARARRRLHAQQDTPQQKKSLQVDLVFDATIYAIDLILEHSSAIPFPSGNLQLNASPKL
jgi:hypothetical protein